MVQVRTLWSFIILLAENTSSPQEFKSVIWKLKIKSYYSNDYSTFDSSLLKLCLFELDGELRSLVAFTNETPLEWGLAPYPTSSFQTTVWVSSSSSSSSLNSCCSWCSARLKLQIFHIKLRIIYIQHCCNSNTIEVGSDVIWGMFPFPTTFGKDW